MASDLEAETKIVRYLMNHPSGVSGTQIDAWLDSCRKDGGFTYAQMCDAKRRLRDQGRIVCTNKIWWLRDIPTAHKENVNARQRINKQRRENRAKPLTSGGSPNTGPRKQSA